MSVTENYVGICEKRNNKELLGRKMPAKLLEEKIKAKNKACEGRDVHGEKKGERKK
jgi:hypothetical protein